MNLKHKATVQINRGHGNRETIFGHIKSETTTHYLVTHETNPEQGEWFAKTSQSVRTRKGHNL